MTLPDGHSAGTPVKVDQEFVDALFSCTGCAQYETVYHVNIGFAEFWEKVREWVVSQGKGPCRHSKLAQSIKDFSNPYNEPRRSAVTGSVISARRKPTSSSMQAAPGPTGCRGSPRPGHHLHRAGLSWTFWEEYCCTSPMLNRADRPHHRFAQLYPGRRRGPRQWSPPALAAADYLHRLRQVLLNTFGLPPPVREQADQKSSSSKRSRPRSLTRPCHLGSWRVFETPMRSSRRYGVELVEMPRNRMGSAAAAGAASGRFNQLASTSLRRG